MRALPGVAPSTKNRSTSAQRLVPEVADAIPDNVLASPIIGEARRFDGTVAPTGWVLAQGQVLRMADYPQLAAILKSSTLRDKTGTFALPNPGFGLIVAAAGAFPTSPAMLARQGRKMTPTDSLGPGARPVLARRISPNSEAIQQKRVTALREQQRFAQSAPRVGPSAPGRISTELAARIEQARDETRAKALSSIGASSRSSVEAVVEAIVSGRASFHEAQLQIADTLTRDEALALLAVHDANQRSFRPEWPGMEHPNPQSEAANFVVDIAFTREQQSAYALLPENR